MFLFATCTASYDNFTISLSFYVPMYDAMASIADVSVSNIGLF